MQDAMNTMRRNRITLPAHLLTLATATSLYRVQVDGNGLAPKYRNNDLIIITPAIDAAPESIPAGSIVLVAVADQDRPDIYQRTGLYHMNADGDLYAGSATVQRGQYIVLGVAYARAKRTINCSKIPGDA